MHTDGQQLVITCNCVSGDTGPEVTCWVVHLRSSHLQVSLTGLRFKVTVIRYLWGETKKKRKKINRFFFFKKKRDNRLQAAKDFTSVSRKRTVKFSYVYSQPHL